MYANVESINMLIYSLQSRNHYPNRLLPSSLHNKITRQYSTFSILIFWMVFKINLLNIHRSYRLSLHQNLAHDFSTRNKRLWYVYRNEKKEPN